MQPALVAPADPVIFTVVVPNERDVATVEVELQIPEGVIPFAFEETPGWKRSERLAADQSLDVVAWTGSLPPGGFVRFSFLAGTPDEPGEITWPTVQTYADGVSARWIGPPDSEEPAAVTVVSADAARQNAGGEGGGASQPEAPPPATEPGGPAAAPAPSRDERHLDELARGRRSRRGRAGAGRRARRRSETPPELSSGDADLPGELAGDRVFPLGDHDRDRAAEGRGLPQLDPPPRDQ